MLALPELPQLPSVASVACAVSTWFFIKYEIIFYMKPSPTSPALPCLSHPLTCANAHFSPRLFVALFMGCSSPALFVNFRGWFDALCSPCLCPCSSLHASGIDNKLYYWICLLPFVPPTVGQGRQSRLPLGAWCRWWGFSWTSCPPSFCLALPHPCGTHCKCCQSVGRAGHKCSSLSAH